MSIMPAIWDAFLERQGSFSVEEKGKTAPPPASPALRAHYEAALWHMNRGEPQSAIYRLQLARDLPSVPEAHVDHLRRAVDDLMGQHWAEARSAIQECLGDLDDGKLSSRAQLPKLRADADRLVSELERLRGSYRRPPGGRLPR